jgi:Glycosyl transferase family 2
VAEPVAVLIAARNEESGIGETVRRLREAFPEAILVVADDGSRDGTAAEAEAAGARVLRLPARGKGQALTLVEREAPAGAVLLCDADLRGDLRPLAASSAELAVAAFARRVGGGFGIAKRTARALVRLRTGEEVREPLSGQRLLTQAARDACFPLAAGFGAETAMTIDALCGGLRLHDVELDLEHRATGRDALGFLHRGRQLRDLLLATVAPQGRNFRGLRLPLVGSAFAVAQPVVTAVGLADDLWSGPERGFRAHVRSGGTTGVLKLVAIPAWAAWRTRSLSGAVLVSLCANLLNQLDTRPGRALKAYALGSLLLRRAPGRADAVAVLIAPYDLREMAMLGDAGSNALGAVLGLSSVARITGRRRWSAIGALAGLTLLGETRSLGSLIERTPVLRRLDSLGREP